MTQQMAQTTSRTGSDIQSGTGPSVVGAVGTAIKYLVLAGGAVIMVLPFLWMANASLMTSGEILAQPPVWIPAQPQFGNYAAVAESLPFGRLYLNSVIVTGCTVFGVLLTS